MVYVALLIVQLLFGANYIVAKFAFHEVAPFTLAVLRLWGATTILSAAWALRRRSTPYVAFARREFGELFLYGMLGATINQVTFLEGLVRSTATNASLIYVTVPVLTLGFAVLLRRERATATGVAGIVIGLVGALILIVPRGNIDFSADATVGNLLLLTGSFSFALYLVLTRPILARHDPLRVMSWVFFFAALTVLPFGISSLRDLASAGLSGPGLASVLYVIVGATAIPYLLNRWALVRVKASIVAVYVLVQPIVAGSLGKIFLGEAFGSHTAIAAVLVVSGVLLSGWRRA